MGEFSFSCLRRGSGEIQVKIYLLNYLYFLTLMIVIKLCIIYFLGSIDERIHDIYARIQDRPNRGR